MQASTKPIFRTAARLPGACLALVLVLAAVGPGRAASLAATVVDQQGVRHEVTNLQYQGRAQLEYYVAGDRRVVPFSRIDRFHLGAESGSENRAISVTLRDGTTENGSIIVDAGTVPHEDVSGGTSLLSRLTGSTSLGPFFMPISSVQDVLLHHTEPASAAVDTVPHATVVLVSGESFEVGDLQFREGRRLFYRVGNKDRYQDLGKVARLEFGDDTQHEEMRPVIITLWTGRQFQGTMEAGRVRLAGETDHAYFQRVYAAFTGKAGAGRFNVGVQDVKLVRFHSAADSTAREAAVADSTQAQGADPGQR